MHATDIQADTDVCLTACMYKNIKRDIHSCLSTYIDIFTCKYECMHPCMSGYTSIYIHTFIYAHHTYLPT